MILIKTRTLYVDFIKSYSPLVLGLNESLPSLFFTRVYIFM